MLVLLSNPRIGFSLALEAGISAGESTEFIDVDGERAIRFRDRSEEHTSELQSRRDLVCRLLLEKKKYQLRRSSNWCGLPRRCSGCSSGIARPLTGCGLGRYPPFICVASALR